MKNEIIIPGQNHLDLLKPTTSELISLIAANDLPSLALYERQMTLQKAIEGTTLHKLSKTINDENLVVIIVYLIDRVSENFNVGKKFTEGQSFIMALDLLDVFKHENLEDILLMFRMARTGKIGDGKDYKLDSQTVFHKWIPQYLEMKIDQREQMHSREKNMTFSNQISLEDVRKAYEKKKSAQKIEDEKNEKIDEITKGFTREQLENLITEWEHDPTKKPMLSYLIKKRWTIK